MPHVLKRVPTTVVLDSSAGVLQELTDLRISVFNGIPIYYRFTIHYTTGNNIGIRFGTLGTAGTARVGVAQPNSVTAAGYRSNLTTNNVNNDIFAETAGNTTAKMAILEGVYVPTADGTFAPMACNEGSGACSVLADSSAIYYITAIAVNPPTETDAATAIARSKRITIGIANEIDASIAIGASQSSPSQNIAVGTATESDSALAIGKSKSRAVGVASETDTATAVARTKRLTIGLASETDSALAVTLGAAAPIELFRAGRVPVRHTPAGVGVVPIRAAAAGPGVVPIVVTTSTEPGVVPVVVTADTAGVVPVVEVP